MNLITKIKQKGISLRVTHIITSIVIIIITALLFALTFYTAKTFSELSTATNNYIEMQKNAEELMNASDYLTQEAQCFTVTFEMENLDNYFKEAIYNRRREKALKSLSFLSSDSEALRQLKNAMDESVQLMQREYYSMLLILEATGNTYRPGELVGMTLTPEDAALPADKKISLAQSMIHDRVYYEKKSAIRTDMENCVDALDNDIQAEQDHINRMMYICMDQIRILGFIQMIIVLGGLLLNKLLGTDPLLKSVQHIKDDKPLPITGSTEFRYLAHTYNKMHEAIKENLSILNYRASHDKLTDVYNRAGYEIISSSIDLSTTTMILIDIDNFKHVNDNFSHPVGDDVLRKLAKTLVDSFRADDLVCRIGGDEFVVFMLHTNPSIKNVIMNKIEHINKLLSTPSEDLPPITLSAGIVIGDEDNNAQRMLRHADIALYKVKDNGKKGCCFYKPNMH